MVIRESGGKFRMTSSTLDLLLMPAGVYIVDTIISAEGNYVKLKRFVTLGIAKVSSRTLGVYNTAVVLRVYF